MLKKVNVPKSASNSNKVTQKSAQKSKLTQKSPQKITQKSTFTQKSTLKSKITQKSNSKKLLKLKTISKRTKKRPFKSCFTQRSTQKSIPQKSTQKSKTQKNGQILKNIFDFPITTPRRNIESFLAVFIQYNHVSWGCLCALKGAGLGNVHLAIIYLYCQRFGATVRWDNCQMGQL